MITRWALLMEPLKPWTGTSTSPLPGSPCGKGWPRLSALKNLIEDPRFRTNDLRRQNRKELNEIVNEITCKRTMAEWIEYLNKEGVPCGPIYNLAQTFRRSPGQTSGDGAGAGATFGEGKDAGFPRQNERYPGEDPPPGPSIGTTHQEILAEPRILPGEDQGIKRRKA